MEHPHRDHFCDNCDAPIYAGQDHCGYCGGAVHRDAQAVAVIALVTLSVLGAGILVFC
jgi:hypothetical protein